MTRNALQTTVASWTAATLSLAASPVLAAGFDKVNDTVVNINDILVTISIAVVTIAIIWAGFKMSPSPWDGGCGGSAVGRPAHRLPHQASQSRSRCASSPGAADATKAPPMP